MNSNKKLNTSNELVVNERWKQIQKIVIYFAIVIAIIMGIMFYIFLNIDFINLSEMDILTISMIFSTFGMPILIFFYGRYGVSQRLLYGVEFAEDGFIFYRKIFNKMKKDKVRFDKIKKIDIKDKRSEDNKNINIKYHGEIDIDFPNIYIRGGILKLEGLDFELASKMKKEFEKKMGV